MQKNDKIYLLDNSEGEVLEYDNLNIVIPKKTRYKNIRNKVSGQDNIHPTNIPLVR